MLSLGVGRVNASQSAIDDKTTAATAQALLAYGIMDVIVALASSWLWVQCHPTGGDNECGDGPKRGDGAPLQKLHNATASGRMDIV